MKGAVLRETFSKSHARNKHSCETSSSFHTWQLKGQNFLGIFRIQCSDVGRNMSFFAKFPPQSQNATPATASDTRDIATRARSRASDSSNQHLRHATSAAPATRKRSENNDTCLKVLRLSRKMQPRPPRLRVQNFFQFSQCQYINPEFLSTFWSTAHRP